jgi:hypothetical protein
MSNIFSLSKVNEVIEKERPVCAVLLDTNVVMNFPSPETWKVAAGSTIFIIPDGTLIELEFLKDKLKKPDQNSQETGKKAIEAIRNIRDLFSKGIIADGIKIPGGWAISVPSPKQNELKTELELIQDIVSAFGPSDAKYLLLTRECDEQFKTPVIMATGEVNLFNIAQANGIPLRLVKGFPMETPLEVTEATKDWDSALKNMNLDTKQKSIGVKLTLNSKKIAPDYLLDGKTSVIVAEGKGTVQDGDVSRPFLWTVTFQDMILTSTVIASSKDTLNLPMVYLDFLVGEGGCEQNLFDEIVERLADCTSASVEAGPMTFQSTESLMEEFILSAYKEGGRSTEEIEELQKNLENDLERLQIEIYSLACETFDQDEIKLVTLFERFRGAVSRCWTIGSPYYFSVILENESGTR